MKALLNRLSHDDLIRARAKMTANNSEDSRIEGLCEVLMAVELRPLEAISNDIEYTISNITSVFRPGD